MDDVASDSPAHGLCEKFHRAVELIGARWTGAILQVLMQGPVRYADLRAAVPDISDRMLCERLRELEDQAIVVRTVSPEPPVRVDYELSAKGRALGPALTAIGRWAEVWVGDRGNEERRTKNEERNEERKEERRTQNDNGRRQRRTANAATIEATTISPQCPSANNQPPERKAGPARIRRRRPR